MSLRDCATLPRAFIPMLSLLVVACQCVWAESAEEIIARCVEREGRLTSGRLDIAIAIREKGGTPGADQKLRFEWQLPDQCRIASLDDPSRTILLFDGERCATRDGTVWSREFLSEAVLSEAELAGIDPSAIVVLDEARVIYSTMIQIFLFPFTMARTNPNWFEATHSFSLLAPIGEGAATAKIDIVAQRLPGEPVWV